MKIKNLSKIFACVLVICCTMLIMPSLGSSEAEILGTLQKQDAQNDEIVYDENELFDFGDIDLDEGEKISLVLYAGNSSGSFVVSQMLVEEVNEKVITDFLSSMSVLNGDVKANSMTQDGDTLSVDFNDALKKQLMDSDAETEALITTSIVNSFIDAYDAKEVYITINGEKFKTNNYNYEYPFEFVPV